MAQDASELSPDTRDEPGPGLPEMSTPTPPDLSHGYEAVASEFIARRNRSRIGVATVRRWAKALPPRAAVLDLACGHGVPIAEALIDEGLAVHGVDASPTLMAAFRARFPTAPAECNAVEDSRFFDRRFDAVVAWGLLFLLAPPTQEALIQKVALALTPGGRFLFTSPREACEWPDELTGRTSRSLGAAAYRRLLEAAGLTSIEEADDEGENHYFAARHEPPALAPR